MPFTEFYIQTTGSNLNAGSENTDAARLTYASGNWVNATNVFTVAAGDPIADGVVVGDFASVYANGAVITDCIGRVTARTTTTITITVLCGSSPADGTGTRTLKIGGAWKGPNAAEQFPFDFVTGTLTNASLHGTRVNCKGGTTYAITAGISHSPPVVSGYVLFEGYTTTIGDGGRAKLDGGTTGASYTLVDFGVSTGDNVALKNWEICNNGATGLADGVIVQATANDVSLINVIIHDIRGLGLTQVGGARLLTIDVETYNCNQSNTAGLGGMKLVDGVALRPYSHNNNRHGIIFGGNNEITLIDPISAENTEYGYKEASHRMPVMMFRPIAYLNTLGGMLEGGSSSQQIVMSIIDAIFVSNGGWQIELGSPISSCCYIIRRAAFFGTVTGQINSPVGASGTPALVDEEGRITLTANPFVDPDNGDFSLNGVVGGGGTILGTHYGFPMPQEVAEAMWSHPDRSLTA